MIARLILTGSLLLTIVAPARAAGAAELWLTWGECAAGGGTSLALPSCSNTLATATLVPTFQVDAPIDSVVAMEIVVDVVTDGASLPDWWRFEPGGCNSGGLVANVDFSAQGACTDPWSGAGLAMAQAWWPGQPRGGANQARLVVTSAIPAVGMATLLAGTPYYGANIRFSLQRGSGPAACAGCAGGACLVLNSIQLIRLPGSSPETVDLYPSGGATSGWAAWQNLQAPCSAVPVRNRTWGALKSLYR